MSRRFVSWRLTGLLLILAGVVAMTVRGQVVTTSEIAEPVSPVNAEAATQEPERMDMAALSERVLPSLSPTLFGNIVAVPPPLPLPNLPPPPPPKPVAPPLPYTYLGQYQNAEGALVFYLRKGDQVIVAKPGTQLDESYRLEADARAGLTFTYLPLKEAQVIPIGNFAQ